MKKGFDHNNYILDQSKFILQRVDNFDKLYLEFGGKIVDDLHAKRVLPGFDKDAKIKLLQSLKDNCEVIICVYAGDIERNKIRSDFGITYDTDVRRLIDELHAYGLTINSVVITRYNNQPAVNSFRSKLEKRGIKVYLHKAIAGYPFDIQKIVSDEGFGNNPYIETSKKIIVVTGPGPGSGKLATCLNQLYHENKKGINVGYSKFETFPVWNLPLKHPVNIAYEAATVDLKDVNMIDSFHLDAYNIRTVNYNRDIEAFPLLKKIIEKITGEPSMYKSPTDMGVNRISSGIIDDDIIQKASIDEIVRRYFKTLTEFKKGFIDKESVNRATSIMEELNLTELDRKCVKPARDKSATTQKNCVAIELNDGYIVTGKETKIMEAAASCLINAIKHLSNLDDKIHLISPSVLEPIFELKESILSTKNAILTVEEIIIALAISATTNPTAALALTKLEELKGCQAHSTSILNTKTEQTFTKLEIDITSDPEFSTDRLYY